MPKYLVSREWLVEAPGPAEAIQATTVTSYLVADQVRARRVPDDYVLPALP